MPDNSHSCPDRGLAQPAPDDAKALILGQFDRAERRFAAISPPGERSAS